jgi:heme-degrading monooxygenase HmoA
MIIRKWRGRALRSNSAAYAGHFRDNVAPQLGQTPGFIGASLGQRLTDETVEFLVLTRWESLEAIENFAGKDIGKAIVEPAAVEALIDFDATVQHFEIIEDIGV